MVGPAAKRAAAAHLQAKLGLSERRACSIVGADQTMVRYRSRRPPDPELRGRLRELASERRRFGYRRLFILLRREGEPSGINRIHRLYREEGLVVRKRRTRRKAYCRPSRGTDNLLQIQSSDAHKIDTCKFIRSGSLRRLCNLLRCAMLH